MQIIYAVIIKHQTSRPRHRPTKQTKPNADPKPTMTGKCRWGTEMRPVRQTHTHTHKYILNTYDAHTDIYMN